MQPNFTGTLLLNSSDVRLVHSPLVCL